MHTRRISRFRALRTFGRSPSWAQRLLARSGVALLVLAIIGIAAVLTMAPWVWTDAFQANKLLDAWSSPTFEELAKVEQHWNSLPYIPDFKRGDEAPIRGMLQRNPLVTAVLDRWGTRTLWIRRGDAFEKAQESVQTQIYMRWILEAEEAQRFQWVPSGQQEPEAGRNPSIVLLGDRWIVIKRWVIGSPDVERALRLCLGASPRFRVALRRTGESDSLKRPLEAWGAPPHLQADAGRLADALFSTAFTSNTFEGWDIVALPLAPDEAAMRTVLRWQFRYASAAAALVGTCLLLGLWLRWRSKRRQLLDGDRLASLAHSLKTPLAILKFRCDSIRLGRLPQDQADAELIRLGEEVDHLSLLIENGLAAIRGREEAGPRREVSAAWIAGIAEDLVPAFEAAGRPLELRLSSDTGRAPLSPLRASIQTLLENALYHGGGEVVMETLRTHRRFLIKVSDHGDGLDALQLEALGKPFMRLREEGKEGFKHEGQGLGLSLLCQVAQREGWGFSLASAPGEGFCATLEIPAQAQPTI